MIFQPIRHTAGNIAAPPVSSYLTFSPLPITRIGGYFLLCYSTLTSTYPLGSMVLCAARTFLSAKDRATSRITAILLFVERQMYKKVLSLRLSLYIAIFDLLFHLNFLGWRQMLVSIFNLFNKFCSNLLKEFACQGIFF